MHRRFSEWKHVRKSKKPPKLKRVIKSTRYFLFLFIYLFPFILFSYLETFNIRFTVTNNKIFFRLRGLQVSIRCSSSINLFKRGIKPT